MRDIYLADTPADAVMLLYNAITGCRDDEVVDIRSLDDTLARWRDEIFA